MNAGDRAQRERTSAWAVLRDRRFVLLWLGGIVTQLAVQTSAFGLPLVLFAVHRRPLQAGLVGGIYAGTAILVKIPAGVLVDRWNRKRLLIVALCTHAMMLLLAGIYVVELGPSIAVLLVAAAVGGTASAFYSPTQTAMIRAIVPRSQLAAAMSQYVARQYVAGLIGPALGGVLVAWNSALTLLVPAALLICSVMLVSTLDVPDQSSARASRKRFVVELGDGLRFIARRPAFRCILVFTSALTLAITMFFFAIVLRLIDLGVPTSAVGVVESVAAVGLLAGAVLAPWVAQRIDMAHLGAVAALLLAVGFLVSATTGLVVLLCVVILIVVLPVPAADAAATAYIVAVTPGDLQGRIGATVGFVTNLPTPLAPVFVGAIVSGLGGQAAVAAAAVAAVVAAAAMATPSVRACGGARVPSAATE